MYIFIFFFRNIFSSRRYLFETSAEDRLSDANKLTMDKPSQNASKKETTLFQKFLLRIF